MLNSKILHLLSLKKKKKNYSFTYLLFKQLKLTGRGSELTDGMCPGMVSMSGYHCVTGFLGFSNIFSHCSRPMPMKSAPIAVQPINSFEPILLKEKNRMAEIDDRTSNHRSELFFDLVAHSPVVIDHFHYEADVLDIFRGHVEHQDLVVHREQSVLLHRGLLLFDPSVLAQQVHFHVRIYEYVFLDIFLFVLSRDDGMDISKDRAVCIYTSFSLTSGK